MPIGAIILWFEPRKTSWERTCQHRCLKIWSSRGKEGRKKVVLDTGCSQTMVHKDLVPQDKIAEGDAVTTRCAHGDMVLYPLVEIELKVDGHPISIEAAESETLPFDVLLGNDVPELTQLLGETALGKTQVDAMVVMTRAQVPQQREEDCYGRERSRVWSTAKLSRVNWRRLRRRDDEPR